jgi:hypothetical protein
MFTDPALKRPGHEADTSLPSNAKVKNKYSYTSMPLYTFMAWTGTAYPFSTNINYVSKIMEDEKVEKDRTSRL